MKTLAGMKAATPTEVEVAACNQTRQQMGIQGNTKMALSAETSLCSQPIGLPTCVDPMLPDVYYLHGLFPTEFLDELRQLMDTLVPSTCSNNMYASRCFFRCPQMANRLLSFLPPQLGYSHVCSDLRFIKYPMGGYIAPHVDGVRQDEETNTPTTTSFLLYLSSIPDGEGGETEFLTNIQDGEVLYSVVPQEGSIALFPHLTPHHGNCVGSYPKILLRGDLY